MNEVEISPVTDDEEHAKIQLLKEFIDTFEKLPQLWDPAHVDYFKKDDRTRALNILLTIYTKIKPGATLKDVRRKLNTLRCNYRKESSKIISSKEQYKPTSWVFYALRFLENLECPWKESSKDIDEMQNMKAVGGQNTTVTINANTKRMPAPPPTFSPRPPFQPPKKKKKLDPLVNSNELLEKTCNYLLAQPYVQCCNQGVIPEAVVWSKKFKTLDPRQKLFVEKAINDILFEGQLGNLHKHSVKINEPA